MKKLLLITVISMVLTSCQNTTDKVANTITGYEFNEAGEKLNLLAGDVGLTKLWMDYTQAHNDRNLDKIAELDAEDIEIYRSNGTIGKGRDTHKQFLGDWFKSSNPNWKVKWMVTNTVAQKDGKNEHWLTTGNEFTDTIDGEEIMMYSIADVNFVDGKIKRINIYIRAKEQE